MVNNYEGVNIRQGPDYKNALYDVFAGSSTSISDYAGLNIRSEILFRHAPRI